MSTAVDAARRAGAPARRRELRALARPLAALEGDEPAARHASADQRGRSAPDQVAQAARWSGPACRRARRRWPATSGTLSGAMPGRGDLDVAELLAGGDRRRQRAGVVELDHQALARLARQGDAPPSRSRPAAPWARRPARRRPRRRAGPAANSRYSWNSRKPYSSSRSPSVRRWPADCRPAITVITRRSSRLAVATRP